MTAPEVIRRYTSISSVIDTLRRRQLALLDPQSWDDRNDRHFMSLYKDHKKAKGLYALCATGASETYHHWRVFGGMSDGACLEIKREPLESAFSGDPRIRIGMVQYRKIEEIERLRAKDRHNLPFLKRLPYEPECEYRIIAETDDPQAPALNIDIDLSWIRRVYLNPWLPKQLADSIKATIRDIDGCTKLSIIQTTMLENSRWKTAGDRLAGKAASPKILVIRKPMKAPPKPKL